MKNIKPTRIKEAKQQEQITKTLTPKRVDESEFIEEVEREEKKRLTKLKAISLFAKKGLIFGSLLASFIVIGTIYDAAFTASSMLATIPVLGVLYLGLLISLVGIISYVLFKQYAGYAKLLSN